MLLPDPDLDRPLHHCLEVISQTSFTWLDLTDIPLPEPDETFYTDRSSYVREGTRRPAKWPWDRESTLTTLAVPADSAACFRPRDQTGTLQRIKATGDLLSALQELGYLVSAKKAQLCSPAVTYLSYDLNQGKCALSARRIQAITHIPTPNTKRQSHEEPKPGDLIEISRVPYSHWALYVGDGYVIHLVSACMLSGAGATSVFSAESSKAVVKRERLKDVVGISPDRVNNYLDKEYKPLPVDKIIISAEKEVGKEMEYHLLSKICKHFVTNLRYGKPRSLQFFEEPEPGDMIEIFHIGYKDWAIYVGDGDVIHLALPSEFPRFGSSNMFIFLSGTAVVTKESLRNAAWGCLYRVNNFFDHKFRPRPVNEIINSAKKMVGVKKKYEVILDNSKRFVTDLRYGWPHCKMVRSLEGDPCPFWSSF
ncbi:PREDICTED: uncharacterized protein LOC109384154 [Hipposideros armiger]|uniref:Uncharacterized protein LOC109384154 n=1 Tax=Hipposideros armiger TaxID=186990 RepID=A0A8B7RI38_HIPAR|nr:PREDICTED: uncharacterized protein LOC109384154 [Hipposideros armiger]